MDAIDEKDGRIENIPDVIYSQCKRELFSVSRLIPVHRSRGELPVGRQAQLTDEKAQ